MLKIAVCDDDLEILKQIQQILIKYPQKLKIEIFSNPEILLQRIFVEPIAFDIFLLDIVIGNVNGIDLAGKIRDYNQEAIIIFITSFLEYAPRGYEVNAFRYLLKPINEPDLLENISNAVTKFSHVDEIVFSVMTRTVCKNFYISDILYMESKNRVVTLKGITEETMMFYGKIDNLEQQSNMASFLRPHQSYLVNPKHIFYIDKKKREIIMKNQDVIPISKSKLDEVIKKYIKGIKEL